MAFINSKRILQISEVEMSLGVTAYIGKAWTENIARQSWIDQNLTIELRLGKVCCKRHLFDTLQHFPGSPRCAGHLLKKMSGKAVSVLFQKRLHKWEQMENKFSYQLAA